MFRGKRPKDLSLFLVYFTSMLVLGLRPKTSSHFKLVKMAIFLYFRPPAKSDGGVPPLSPLSLDCKAGGLGVGRFFVNTPFPFSPFSPFYPPYPTD